MTRLPATGEASAYERARRKVAELQSIAAGPPRRPVPSARSGPASASAPSMVGSSAPQPRAAHLDPKRPMGKKQFSGLVTGKTSRINFNMPASLLDRVAIHMPVSAREAGLQSEIQAPYIDVYEKLNYKGKSMDPPKQDPARAGVSFGRPEGVDLGHRMKEPRDPRPVSPQDQVGNTIREGGRDVPGEVLKLQSYCREGAHAGLSTWAEKANSKRPGRDLVEFHGHLGGPCVEQTEHSYPPRQLAKRFYTEMPLGVRDNVQRSIRGGPLGNMWREDDFVDYRLHLVGSAGLGTPEAMAHMRCKGHEALIEDSDGHAGKITIRGEDPPKGKKMVQENPLCSRGVTTSIVHKVGRRSSRSKSQPPEHSEHWIRSMPPDQEHAGGFRTYPVHLRYWQLDDGKWDILQGAGVTWRQDQGGTPSPSTPRRPHTSRSSASGAPSMRTPPKSARSSRDLRAERRGDREAKAAKGRTPRSSASARSDGQLRRAR
eukprot:TRINITY_DN46485_c0_g1_i1.p1 TRINITY_DN46485_c0_g1~~TRINITY_DN46485_c0_g1_i1.p1  ORF type:complete len:486 (-),score=51.00 TRINITY_DN46485_c0_g1_i1:64-1521(-)